MSPVQIATIAVYLIGIAFLACAIIDVERDLRRAKKRRQR